MPRLWIGSVPPSGDLNPMDLLVLAAEEYQLDEVGPIEGPQILQVPLPDNELSEEQKHLALEAGAVVARFLQADKNVLSTCAMGINRSSLIAALALVMLGGKPEEILKLIREKRNPAALCNPYFVEFIYQTYVEILEKEIDGLLDAINKMIGTRSSAAHTHTR